MQKEDTKLNHRHQMGVPDWIWDQAQERWGLKDPSGHLRDFLSECWSKYNSWNGNDQPKPSVKTKPTLRGDKGYWGGDAALARDMEDARQEFLDHCDEFWTEARCLKATGRYDKELEDVQSFLESIEGQEYDDLTDKQRGLLGAIRRVHQYWVQRG